MCAREDYALGSQLHSQWLERLSTGIKIEKLGADYDPRMDTVIRALVRTVAESAAAGAAEEE